MQDCTDVAQCGVIIVSGVILVLPVVLFMTCKHFGVTNCRVGASQSPSAVAYISLQWSVAGRASGLASLRQIGLFSHCDKREEEFWDFFFRKRCCTNSET